MIKVTLVNADDWQGLVTLIGYLFILRGIIGIFFPSQIQKKLSTVFSKGYWFIFLFLLIVGTYLTYEGFTN